MPGQNARATFYVVFPTILILHYLFYAVKNQLSWHSVPAFWNRLLRGVYDGSVKPIRASEVLNKYLAVSNDDFPILNACTVCYKFLEPVHFGRDRSIVIKQNCLLEVETMLAAKSA